MFKLGQTYETISDQGSHDCQGDDGIKRYNVGPDFRSVVGDRANMENPNILKFPRELQWAYLAFGLMVLLLLLELTMGLK